MSEQQLNLFGEEVIETAVKRIGRNERFEYGGENFHVVIEDGKLTFTDKETGKVIERK